MAEVLAQLTPGSKTVVRLRLMHWTGMRRSQMGHLPADDFPPQLQKHAATIERLQHADRMPAPAPRGIRLADPAGSIEGIPVSH